VGDDVGRFDQMSRRIAVTLTEHAERLAVGVKNTDDAAPGVGQVHPALARVDAARPHERRLAAHLADERAVACENLHSLVPGVGDVNVVAVDADVAGFTKLAVLAAFPAPGTDERAIRSELLHPTVDALGDVQIAARIECRAHRLVELARSL